VDAPVTTPPITPPAPIVPPARAAAPPAVDDALQTNTLAELYLKQGLVERAMEVYRAMLRVDASNERARRRLAELEGSVAAGESPATRRPAAPGREEQGGPASASTPTTPSPTIPDPSRATVARLERWRDRMMAGKTGGMRGVGR
jgi:pentatricopeptide repeat protein